MKHMMKGVLCSILFLSACSSVPSPLPEDSPKEIEPLPEATYPQPELLQPFYFEHTLTTTDETFSAKGILGNYQIQLSRITNIRDPQITDAVNRWMDQKVETWLEKGLAKYPGILNDQSFQIQEPVDISFHVYSAINNIAQFQINRSFYTPSMKYYSDMEKVYLNLKTGQEITINDVMNSNDGLHALNQYVLQSIDSFTTIDEADEIGEFGTLYKVPFLSAFRGFEKQVYFELNYPNTGLTIWLDPANCDSCNYQNRYNPVSMHLPMIRSSLYDRHFMTDKEEYITDGTIKLNQPFSMLSFLPQSVFDKKRRLTIETDIPADTPAYLREEADVLLTQLREQIKQYELLYPISWDDTYSVIRLSILPGNWSDSIHLLYHIGDNPKLSGDIWRNYHPQTKKIIHLSDLFQKEYDLQSKIDQKVAVLVAVSEKEKILAMLDDRNFAIYYDGISVSFNKELANMAEKTISSISLPLDYLGAENFDLSNWQK